MAKLREQTQDSLVDRVREIGRLLEEEYGRPTQGRKKKPLDQLIATILSQHTSDANSDRAFECLKDRFPSWKDVRDADPGEIAEAIKPGGLARVKAPRIKELLQCLGEGRDSLDLDFLDRMELEEAREFLLRLKGVGPKTAACVLLFSCGLPAFPVDTHIHRVARRLGLIGPDVSAEQAHEILESSVPPEAVFPFHVNVITHGRRVCKAQKPRCEICVLAPRCEYYLAVSDQPSAVSPDAS